MKERVIIALDLPSYEEAKKVVDALPDAVIFKVGLQAFLGFGDAIISYLQKKGKLLFLDLKFFDIPNTVAGAVRSVLRHRPVFLTIHLSGGRDMAEKSLEAASANPSLVVLGVTVITSLSDANLAEMGHSLPARDMVLNLFRLGRKAGMKGFVCSPEEVEILRREGGNDFLLVTPGIRPDWAEAQDQKRIFTPAKAIAAGSSCLVIGRPITHHPRPAEAFARIIAEMEAASSS